MKNGNSRELKPVNKWFFTLIFDFADDKSSFQAFEAAKLQLRREYFLIYLLILSRRSLLSFYPLCNTDSPAGGFGGWVCLGKGVGLTKRGGAWGFSPCPSSPGRFESSVCSFCRGNAEHLGCFLKSSWLGCVFLLTCRVRPGMMSLKHSGWGWTPWRFKQQNKVVGFLIQNKKRNKERVSPGAGTDFQKHVHFGAQRHHLQRHRGNDVTVRLGDFVGEAEAVDLLVGVSVQKQDSPAALLSKTKYDAEETFLWCW